jgi:hypothetical protein
MMDQNLTLEDLDGGNVALQITEVLRDAVRDIADPDKKATKPRIVTATIILAPSKSRREAEVSYQVTLKPSVHADREKTVIYLGKDKEGNPIAKPWIPNQGVLPGVENAFDARDESGSDDRSN